MPEPQYYCSLPWCGKGCGMPLKSRKFRVSGKLERFVYPYEIDMHDIVPRSQGGDAESLDNNVPICHSCHMAHHNDPSMKLTFDVENSSVERADGKSGSLILGERSPDDAPPDW